MTASTWPPRCVACFRPSSRRSAEEARVRAIVMREYGGPECLVPAERPDPVADPDWAVVRLRAAALNWHDVLVRQGRSQSPLPHVPGAEGAGTDAETGEDVLVVPSLWWGDDESAPGPSWEILGAHRPGTYAEMVRVPRECVVPTPARLSWPESAALPPRGLTPYRAPFPPPPLPPAASPPHLSPSGAGLARRSAPTSPRRRRARPRGRRGRRPRLPRDRSRLRQGRSRDRLNAGREPSRRGKRTHDRPRALRAGRPRSRLRDP